MLKAAEGMDTLAQWGNLGSAPTPLYPTLHFPFYIIVVTLTHFVR